MRVRQIHEIRRPHRSDPITGLYFNHALPRIAVPRPPNPHARPLGLHRNHVAHRPIPPYLVLQGTPQTLPLSTLPFHLLFSMIRRRFVGEQRIAFRPPFPRELQPGVRRGDDQGYVGGTRLFFGFAHFKKL